MQSEECIKRVEEKARKRISHAKNNGQLIGAHKTNKHSDVQLTSLYRCCFCIKVY